MNALINNTELKKELVNLRERVDFILLKLEQGTKPAPVKRVAQKISRKDKYKQTLRSNIHGNSTIAVSKN